MPTSFLCHQGDDSQLSFQKLLPDIALQRSNVLANAVNEDDHLSLGVVVLPRGANMSFFDAWLAYIQEDAHPHTLNDLLGAIQVCVVLSARCIVSTALATSHSIRPLHATQEGPWPLLCRFVYSLLRSDTVQLLLRANTA